jgi:hypothetical protein
MNNRWQVLVGSLDAVTALDPIAAALVYRELAGVAEAEAKNRQHIDKQPVVDAGREEKTA